MIYVLALIGLVTVVVLLWKAFGPTSTTPARVQGPDDDPEFLWRMSREAERERRDDDPSGER
ncbi:hypothetical protein DW322_19460 [Rhodococcus rhodnii]|uniref:Uncharacterized protein n=2 Tax=Rhodococcus rhodnii TaxID=38312 RepID=R7WPD5_9NOCA|nr:hypothetical protein [Rhodococcus rhodnii]EOM77182.1 hypothetical protein Rrhod_1430 [Rhodococcus rhodnii LMG 5362]TXG92896.1 hypothetical protein DW322_19460 [Rhodococcus rhodnii]